MCEIAIGSCIGNEYSYSFINSGKRYEREFQMTGQRCGPDFLTCVFTLDPEAFLSYCLIVCSVNYFSHF